MRNIKILLFFAFNISIFHPVYAVNPPTDPGTNANTAPPHLNSLSVQEEILWAKERKKRWNPSTSEGQQSLEILENYLNILDFLNSPKVSTTSPTNACSLTPGVKKGIIETLYYLDQIFDRSSQKINLHSLYALIQYIESNKSAWINEAKQHNTPKHDQFDFHFDVPSQSKKKSQIMRIHITSNPDGLIYLRFGEGIIGRGSYRTYEPLYIYREQKNLDAVRGIPRSDKRHPSVSLEEEKLNQTSFLEGVYSESKAYKRLADYFKINSITPTGVLFPLAHSIQEIILERFDGNMFGNKYKFENHLWDALIQTTQGLSLAHDANVCHGDIKPDNFLFKLSKREPPKFAISDFNLAFFCEEQIGKFQDKGTRGYRAPELVDPNQSLKRKTAEDIKKSEVYSLAVSVYEIQSGKNFPGYTECFDKFSSKNQVEKFEDCALKAVKAFVEKTNTRLTYSSFDQLIAAALREDWNSRINVHQFLDGLRFLKEKSTPAKTLQPLSDQDLKRLSVQNISIQQAQSLLANKPRAYLLHFFPPRSTSNQPYKIAISYESGGKVITKFFDTLDRTSIEAEIRFLKGIETIGKEFIPPPESSDNESTVKRLKAL